MRAHLLLLLAIGLLASMAHGKTVFRRTDKISENFKQLDLTPDEIDPDVAPPEPPKEDILDPEDVVDHSNVPTETVEDPIVEEDEATSVDESANEVDAVIDEALAAASPAFVGVGGGSAAAAAIEAPVPVPAPAAAAASAAVASSPAKPAVAPATAATPVKDDTNTNGLAKYCKCKDSHCDCCRKFSLPLIPVNGPGCARISYLGNEKMSVSIKYGDITLASRTISSKNARPICVGLPGGYSKFCGRVYGLSKEKSDKNNFKACLGFELRAEDEVEAALRVSCFKFGPEGLRVADAEPFPEPPKAEDDDDDDDIFGFAAGGDDEEDEDEEDYDADEADDDAEDDDDDADDVEPEDDDDEAPEDADYGGFSLAGLIDELDDDDEEPAAASVKPQASPASSAAAAVAVDQTRAVAQSKDDKGTEADASAAVTQEASVEAAVADAVTAAPASDATTVKGKKSKKSKKNKKKKAAAAADASESGFAYEILNGILDFFN